MGAARTRLHVSERRACKVLLQARSTQRYVPILNPDQGRLRARIIEIAKEYGRYGYRQVTRLLDFEGWSVGHDRVYSIWREEGLQVQKNSQNERDFGWPMDPAYGSDPSDLTMSGRMILLLIEPTMEDRSRFSI